VFYEEKCKHDKHRRQNDQNPSQTKKPSSEFDERRRLLLNPSARNLRKLGCQVNNRGVLAENQRCDHHGAGLLQVLLNGLMKALHSFAYFWGIKHKKRKNPTALFSPPPAPSST